MDRDHATVMLSLNSMMAALSAVLGFISLDFGNLKFTFEGLPVLLSALMFGPGSGMAVGAVGTLIYQILRYGMMVTTPLWMLPYIVLGFMAGSYARRYRYANTNRQLVFIIFATSLTVTLINTLMIWIDSKVYSYYSFAYVFGAFPLRIMIALIKSAAYSAVVPTILKKMSRITKNGMMRRDG